MLNEKDAVNLMQKINRVLTENPQAEDLEKYLLLRNSMLNDKGIYPDLPQPFFKYLQVWISSGCSIDSYPKIDDLNPFLFKAIEHKDIAAIKILLQNGLILDEEEKYFALRNAFEAILDSAIQLDGPPDYSFIVDLFKIGICLDKKDSLNKKMIKLLKHMQVHFPYLLVEKYQELIQVELD
jgi:hypothetical protein